MKELQLSVLKQVSGKAYTNGVKLKDVNEEGLTLLINSGRLTSIAKDKLPALMAYRGVRGTYTPTNVGFIDIDTTEYVSEIINNIDNVFSNIPCIEAVQESFSGKLHIIYRLSNDVIDTVDEYNDKHLVYTLAILHILKGLGYDYFELAKENPKIIDTHNLKWSQPLFISPKPFYFNPFGSFAVSISKKDVDMLLSTYNVFCPSTKMKTKTITKDTDPVFQVSDRTHTDGKIELRSVEHGGVTVFGYSGNDARWRITSTLKAMLGVEKAYKFIGDHFVQHTKYDYNTSWCEIFPLAQDWLLSTFPELEPISSFTNVKEGLQMLKDDEYMSDRIDEILEFFYKHERMSLCAPCGTGKTTLINGKEGYEGLAKRLSAVVIVPFNVTNHLYSNLVEVSSATYNEYPKDEACVMVWDQAIKYDLGERVVIVDESHTLFHDREYRTSAIKLLDNLKNVKRVICVSATPEGEVEELGLSQLKYYQNKNSVIMNTVSMNKKNETFIRNKILRTVPYYDNIAVFSDSLARKLYYSLLDSGVSLSDMCLLHSNCKSTSDFIAVRDTELLSKKITLSTCIAYNGLNFNNTGSVHIILEHTDNTAAEIVQCIGRFRKAKRVLVTLVHTDINREERLSVADKRKIADNYSSNTILFDDFEYLLDDQVYSARSIVEKYRDEHSDFDVVLNEIKEIAPYITIQNTSEIECEKAVTIQNKHKRDQEVLALNDCMNSKVDRYNIDDYYRAVVELFYDISEIISGTELPTLNTLLSWQKQESLPSTRLNNIKDIITICRIDDETFNSEIKMLKDAVNTDNNKLTKKRIFSKIKHIESVRKRFKDRFEEAKEITPSVDGITPSVDAITPSVEVITAWLMQDEYDNYISKKRKAQTVKQNNNKSNTNKVCALFNYIGIPVAIFNSYIEAGEWCNIKQPRAGRKIHYYTGYYYADGTNCINGDCLLTHKQDVRTYTLCDYDGDTYTYPTVEQRLYTSFDDMCSKKYPRGERIMHERHRSATYTEHYWKYIIETVEIFRELDREFYGESEELDMKETYSFF